MSSSSGQTNEMEEFSSMLNAYTNDTMIWVKNDEADWKTAKIVEKKINSLEVEFIFNELETNKQSNIKIKLNDIKKNKDLLPPLKNPSDLDLAKDLTALNFLNEPAILNVIKNRYLDQQIYTYSGIVLIAMNPFCKVDLYENQYIELYEENKSTEPHLFAVAQNAYSNMINAKLNQTVIVSGESGAGKTVSAKFIMRYFASLRSPTEKKDVNFENKRKDGLSKTEEQILATNPILEAFGNAKTTRNDNSSRFGKYIEILFDSNVAIIGARIRTYLLERSRLISQSKNERNYHIFYQLCKGATKEIKDRLMINDIESFSYTNQGDAFTINNVDDEKEFLETCRSLELIGINEKAQRDVFSVLATVLHLGNISITGSEKSVSNIDDQDKNLLAACDILQISSHDLKKWIINKQIITRSEKIIKKMTPSQANLTKDSVSKYLYANIFDWLIKCINAKLSKIEKDIDYTFIGVLDIYGFEHFEKNSFEQFCINYANEKLQQQFTQHVFKIEQEEYIKEEINWDVITFSDNQLCIDIIEGKLGILSLLNEQSKLPSGSDSSFINKLYSSFNNKEYETYFSKPRFSNSSFTITHYADSVDYEAEGFLEKNSDSINDEILEVLRSSKIEFIGELLQKEESTPSMNSKLSKTKTQTLSSTFKSSLSNLMETIKKTEVHYIRCIKPNKEKESFKFDTKMTLSQLRACGVLETIKISSRGYSSKMTFEEFAEKYKNLLYSEKRKSSAMSICRAVLEEIPTDKYQIGKTKIFMKSQQLALFEAMILNKNHNSATTLQKHFRRLYARKIYLRLMFLVAAIRCKGLSKAMKKLHDIFVSVKTRPVQVQYRAYYQRTKYLSIKSGIIHVQAYVRKTLSKSAVLKQKRTLFSQKVAVKKIQNFITKNRNKEQLELPQNITDETDTKKNLILKPPKSPELTDLPSKQKETTDDYLNLDQNSLINIIMKKDAQIENLSQEIAKLITVSKEKEEELSSTKDSMEELKLTMEEYDVKESDEYQALEKDYLNLKEELQTMKSERPNTVVNGVKNKQASNRYSRQFTNGLSTIYSKFSTNTKINDSTDNKRASVISFDKFSTNSYKPGFVEEEEEEYLVTLETPLLVEEIIEELITNLNVPAIDIKHKRKEEEMIFPANLIGMCTIQMHSEELTSQLNFLIMEVCGAIQSVVETIDQDFMLVYWLSNVLHLLSVLTTASRDLEYDIEEYENDFDTEDVNLVVINSIKRIKTLAEKIKEKFLKAQNVKLLKLTVQGLIEYQSLDGYVTNDNNFFNRLVGQTQPVSIVELISYLSNVLDLMEFYYVKPSVNQFIIEYLVDFIGTEAFNNLIQRKGFLSWKRGTQIQYNISKLEEWLNQHLVNTQGQNVHKFVQIAKLLQMQKASFKDLEHMLNVSDLLNNLQIQRILSNYIVDEDDKQINAELIKEVNRRASLNDKNEHVLVDRLMKTDLDLINVLGDSDVEANSYIPNNMKLKRLRLIASKYNNNDK